MLFHRPFLADIGGNGPGQLPDQGFGRLPLRQIVGDKGNGVQHIIEQLDKYQHRAHGDPPAGQGQVCPHQKYAKLHHRAGQLRQQLNQDGNFFPLFLGLGNLFHLPGEDAAHLGLGPEGFDHGKAHQTVPQGGYIGFIPVGDLLFCLRRPVAGQQGRSDGQQGQGHGQRR